MYELYTFLYFLLLLTTSKTIDITGFMCNCLLRQFLLIETQNPEISTNLRQSVGIINK